MANYPKFPFYAPRTIQELYQSLESWVNELTRELDAQDTFIEAAPSTNIYTVTSVSEIGRPSAGDVAYSTSSSKFRGYTTTATGWVDFN
jgi:hypothetical protein